MSSAPASGGPSVALARFAVAAHAGPEFRRACAAARALHEAALLALAAPDATAAALLAGSAFFATGAQARACGSSQRVGALAAALANGAAFAARPEIGAQAPTVAAALACGDLTDAPADAVIAAIAVGCEAAERVARSVAGAEFAAGWNEPAVVGHFGALAAAARLLELDEDQARHALGLAATQAAGIRAAAGSPAGYMACGKAAADALESAQLARHGFTSAAASIEGRRGFAALSAGVFDPEALLAGLGVRWLG